MVGMSKRKSTATAIAIVLALLLLGANAYEPTNFVATKTNLLEEGETASESASISHGEKGYYVVKVEINGEFTGFIALDKKEERAIEKEDVTVKKLFQTAKFALEYADFKAQVESNPSLTWFLLSTNIVRNIARLLEDEKNDLDIVSNQLEDTEATVKIAEMKSRLSEMESMLLTLSEKMDEANSLESTLSQKTGTLETGMEDSLKDSLIEVFVLLGEIDNAAVEYNTELKALQRIISSSGLDAESQKSLMGYSRLPNDFHLIGNWASGVSGLKEGVKGVHDNALASSLELMQAFNRRIERASAFGILYAEDQELYKETDNTYKTANSAAESMLSPEYRSHWENQESTALLESNWEKAEAYYQKGDYDKAKSFGLKAKKNITDVFADGFKQDPGPTYRWDLLIAGSVLIIIALIIIYTAKNRKKLAGFIQKEETDEEVAF